MKPRKDYHRNHSKADELEDVCKPCKAVRDAARRRSRATVLAVYLPLPIPLRQILQAAGESPGGPC